MTPSALTNVIRGRRADGSLRVDRADEPAPPGDRELFVAHLSAIGIDDPAKADRLYREHRARTEAARGK